MTRLRVAVESLIASLIALAIYTVFAQRTMYGDVTVLLMKAAAGDVLHPNHFAYLPILVPFADALSGSRTLHESAVLLSALGAAVGVGLVYAASRMLGLARMPAIAATAAVATAPSLMFFATLVELHGPFFAFFGVCAVAFAWYRRSPGVWRVVMLAVTTAAAYLAHATGHLLVGLFATWAVAVASDHAARRRAIRDGAVLAVVHVALVFAATRALQSAGYPIGGEHNASAFAMYFAASIERPLAFFVTLWNEWLLPFAPLCIAWLFAGRRGTGFAIALLGYVAFTFFVLADHPEHGAYLLPLAWPAALLTVEGLGARRTFVAAALGLVIGAIGITLHDEPTRADAYVRGVDAVRGPQRAMLLCAFHLQDMEARFVGGLDASADFFEVSTLTDVPANAMDATVAAIETQIRALTASGRKVFVTAEARAHLGAEYALRKRPEIARVTALLFQRMDAIPVESHGFRAHEIRPR
jgi:hypothetical protein